MILQNRVFFSDNRSIITIKNTGRASEKFIMHEWVQRGYYFSEGLDGEDGNNVLINSNDNTKEDYQLGYY